MAYNNPFKADGVNALVEETYENNLERQLHCVSARDADYYVAIGWNKLQLDGGLIYRRLQSL